MMTAAPDMNPEMTVWEMKLVIQPRLKMPTRVYITPAMNATCAPRQGVGEREKTDAAWGSQASTTLENIQAP